MGLNYDQLIEDLDKTFDQMIQKNIQATSVCHIGEKTESLGFYFAKAFDCSCIQLPSANRKGRNSDLTKIVNSIYPFFPECFLKILSYQYKRIYSHAERFLPDFNLNRILEGNLILLVDDNCFTGRTFELWKDKIKEETNKNVKTFSITITGNYKPDFYCIDGWRSFEWRPIGI